MQLTKNFYSEEFLCPCGKCGGGKMSPAFMAKLQALRDLVNFPLTISSGARCEEHNKVVGGEKDSQHMPNAKGESNAADIEVLDGSMSYAVQAAAFTVGFKGIALKRKSGQKGIVHVDDRQTIAVTWSY